MNRGFVAISTVLVLMAVMSSAVVAITYLAVGELQATRLQTEGEKSLYLAESCVEGLLQKIHDDPGFTGTNISYPEGICTLVYNSGGPNWDVTVSGDNPLSKRIIRVQFTRGNSISVSKWTEE